MSTTARHSVATAVIVEPTPQIALSVAVATEAVPSRHRPVMYAVRSYSSPLVALEFSDSII